MISQHVKNRMAWWYSLWHMQPSLWHRGLCKTASAI